MKIRIKGNSIRLRLTKPEVDGFGNKGIIAETTGFGNAVFGYALAVSKDKNTLSAAYEGNTITVYMPEAMRTEWIETDVVGFQDNMDIGNGEKLFLLIEKDWVCIDNTIEDQSDNYPNPNMAC